VPSINGYEMFLYFSRHCTLDLGRDITVQCDLKCPSGALMFNRGSMTGLATEIRQNVKFSPEIPVRLVAGHLVLSSFSYVTTHLATSAFLFLLNISVNVSYLGLCVADRD